MEKTRQGFTMIEMLVVVGILGILMAILMGNFTGATESARSAKCLANLKNLANAVQAYGMSSGGYPYAGSMAGHHNRRTGSKYSDAFYSRPGWIGWYDGGAFEGEPGKNPINISMHVSTYGLDPDQQLYCLKTGTLWQSYGANRMAVVCPSHLEAMKGNKPCWSYVLNKDLGYDATKGKGVSGPDTPVPYGYFSHGDRRLLFAELPYLKFDEHQPDTSSTPGQANDPVLNYGAAANGAEYIGFNHATGKNKVAHVVFFDCHVEKISYPSEGLSYANLCKLTKLLCEAHDITFNGRRYEQLGD